MIEVVSPDLQRNWPAKKLKLLIPGGWKMLLPAIQVDEEYRLKCVRHFMAKGGMGKAQAHADSLIQQTGQTGFLLSLRASIFYYAKIYCEMYPDRLTRVHRNVFTPVGYKPEVIAGIHVPDRYPGNVGVQQARKLLGEMEI